MYKFSGTVKKHSGRGTKLGFPTANIAVPDDAPEGIFLAWTTVKDQKYPSLFFVGQAKTFDEKEKHGESYILDFEAELYGQQIIVRIIEKLRDNEKFDSSEELVRQMQRDEERAREYFASLEK